MRKWWEYVKTHTSTRTEDTYTTSSSIYIGLIPALIFFAFLGLFVMTKEVGIQSYIKLKHNVKYSETFRETQELTEFNEYTIKALEDGSINFFEYIRINNRYEKAQKSSEAEKIKKSL